MTEADATEPATPNTQARPSADDIAELEALVAEQLDAEQARRLRMRLAGDRQLLAAFGVIRSRAVAADTPPGDHPNASSRQPGDDQLRERLTRGRLVVVAATLLTVVAAMVLVATVGRTPAPTLPDTTTPLVATAADLGSIWPTLAAGPTDLGYLTEQGRLTDCWPLGVPPILGARPAIVDGRYGIAVATPDSEQPAMVQLTVLGRDCNDLNAGIIAEARVPH